MASSSVDGAATAADAPKLPVLTALDGTDGMDIAADGSGGGGEGGSTTSLGATARPAPPPPAPAATAPAANAPPPLPPTAAASSDATDAPEDGELVSPTKQTPPAAPDAAPRRPPVAPEDKARLRTRGGPVVPEGNGWPATFPSIKEPTPLYMPRQPPRPVRRTLRGGALPWGPRPGPRPNATARHASLCCQRASAARLPARPQPRAVPGL